ncbi:aldehyde dehydrogenase family protein, partial [Streptomyces chrestomyceticus]|uniref:aldehyde dehydrogenase family protein n=1 Tax=Streptomyces chrestomyceticus TaxID=68185 RepID=UPI0035A93839
MTPPVSPRGSRDDTPDVPPAPSVGVPPAPPVDVPPAPPVPLGRLPVGDGWVPAPRTGPVIFPYDGEEFATAPVGDPDLACRAVEHAAAVRPRVAKLAARVRRQVLGGVAADLADVAGPMEDLLVRETGKPRIDCRT